MISQQVPNQKQQLKEVKYWSVPSPLQGNIFMFGRIGGGKTCKLLTIVQGYHAKGFKIWDLFGGKRGEGPFWSLPNDDNALWEQMKLETYDLAEAGPKQYKVNLLYPMFAKQLPPQLPENSPNVKARVFTIPINDIEERDISLVMGAIGSNAKMLWDNIHNSLSKNDNGADIQFLMDTRFKKLKREAIYNLFLKPLIDEKLLASTQCDLNLDWIEEARDRETVSVLCLDFVPERFKFFVMGYVIKTLVKLAMEDKIHKKNIAVFREASAFMKVQDADKSKEETTQVFRNQVTEAARYARSGFFLAMDTQDSSEVRGMIEGCLSEDTMVQVLSPSLQNAALRDLPENFTVPSLNFKSGSIEAKSARKTDTGEKDCYQLTFENGESVLATADHRFFGSDYSEKRVHQLKEGDELLFLADVG